uniref:Palmitoyltransferase n=1 Tax=Schistocephalus solidus TaxID=70667 RepID=A0A0V0J3E0_SCHSO
MPLVGCSHRGPQFYHVNGEDHGLTQRFFFFQFPKPGMWAFTRQPVVCPTETVKGSCIGYADSNCDFNLDDLLTTCTQRVGVSVLLAKLGRMEGSALPESADWLQSRSLRTGLTLLQVACSRNFPLLAAMLLEAGVDPNATTTADGSTAAHFAAGAGNPFLLHLLSLYGGNLNMADAKGKVPAHIAAENGNAHALVWLLDVEKVCTLDVKDNLGRTPLHLACLQGDRIILECLLASLHHSGPWMTAATVKASITDPILCQDNLGNTCLHAAFVEHSTPSRNRTQRRAVGRAIFWTLLSNASESAAPLLASRNHLGQRPLESFISSVRTRQWAFHGLLLLSTHALAFLRPPNIPVALTLFQYLLTGLHFLVPLLLAVFAYLGQWVMTSVLPVYVTAGLLAVLVTRQHHRTCDGTEQQNPLFCGLFFSVVVCVSFYDLLHFQPSLEGTLGWVRFLPGCLGYPLWFATFGALCLVDPGRLVPQHIFRNGFAHLVESSTIVFLSAVKDLMANPTLPTKLPELPNYSERYCPSCDVLLPSVDVYVKHCRLCKCCYVDHDHHCLFLYNCVAGRNFRLFLFFLLLTVLLALVFSVVALIYACQRCGLDEKVDENYPGAYKVYLLVSCTLHTLPCLSVLLLVSVTGVFWLIVFIRRQFTQFTHQYSLLIDRFGLWRVLLGLHRPQV